MKYMIETAHYEDAKIILRDYPKLYDMENVVQEDGCLYLITDSLEDIEFIRKNTVGEIIILPTLRSDKSKGLSLIIYDGYVE